MSFTNARSKLSQLIFIALQFFLVIVLCACDLFLPNPYIQPIADSIEIGPEWRTIKLTNPLKVIRQEQTISIYVPDISKWDIEAKDNSFIDPDGLRLKIEMQIVRNDGSSFTMNTIGLGPGLTFSYIPNEKVHVRKTRFPEEMIFDKLRIHANRKLIGGKVEWICETNY